MRCFNCYPGFCEHPTDIPLWDKIGPEAAAKIYSPASMGSCAINPKTGFGFYPETLPEPKASRKVLIVGGGVGGCQAAITAVERGHQVILCEKTGKLGGTINFTDRDEDKVDLRNAKNVIIGDALRSGAEIRLNVEVDRELIDEIQPDAMIIAVGAHPFVPAIPGIDKAMNALDVYDRMYELGKHVVIVGGGLVGCEVGLHIANHGHDVTIIEMLPMIANETFGYYRNALLTEMDNRGIRQILNAKCLEFTDAGVRIQRDGKEELIPADSMCFSMGMRSNDGEVQRLKEAAGEIPTWVVGDAKHAGKVADAVHGGYLAAMEIV